ncbi:hypothetical protein DFH07DRAFT_970083 [Mycena maculata]|uniref:Protein kinase domain-containing protein n=1 Tax=Mycena maculata TaxID=230809 RepID=A0AAD7MPZ6_9AGAR|nr:hypothetical protein DFH07DRAFT_970083 [Mycena maculata]
MLTSPPPSRCSQLALVHNKICISSGNPNIVTLYDYLEMSHNLYLCFDLCTGGEPFDRICTNINYYQAYASLSCAHPSLAHPSPLPFLSFSNAAGLVRMVFTTVKYIHASGIEADIMITDFGLSCITEGEKLSILICGTPGYMVPEIFLKRYTPFDRDTSRPKAEMEAIITGDYKFELEDY